MTIETLLKLYNTPITDLQREQLTDAEAIHIDSSKSQFERIQSFLEQTKNPFAQNVGKYILQIHYLEESEETLDDRMILLARKQTAIDI